MLGYRYKADFVYIFENTEAKRVKVGMTSNNVILRLNDVNDMWLEKKVTCQICGGRRQANRKGIIPYHVLSGKECFGGNALPLERDVTLAEMYLIDLKKSLNNLAGSEKGSVSKMINTIEKRIIKYRNYKKPVGVWEFKIAYATENAEEVEKLSHKSLSDYLDSDAPFGEVFYCSVAEAIDTVETVLQQLNLWNYTKILRKL